MSYQLIRLSAGLEMRVDIPGRLILVDSVSTGQGVDIALLRNGTPVPYIPGRQAGFRLVEDFGGVLLRSALDCEVGIFLSVNDVQLGGTAGGNVVVPDGVSVVNDLAHSIPVNFAGTVSPVLGVVTVDNTNAKAIPVLQKPGEVFEVHVNNAVPMAVSLTETKINNSDAQAVPVVPKVGAVFSVKDVQCSTIVNIAPVSAGLAAVALVADATLRRLRVRNGHATATIALGGVGITMATAAIVLAPGDIWNESEAASASWYVISDTAATPVLMQGLK